MEKKRTLIRGIVIGLALFIVAQIFSLSYALLVMRLVPNGATWTPMRGLLVFSTKVVYWICCPLSHIFYIFVGHPLILSKYGSLMLSRGIDLIFWISISILIIYIKNKKKSII